MLALVAIGLVMLASTGMWVPNVEDHYLFLRKQAILVGVGLVACAIFVKVKPEVFRRTYIIQLVLVSVMLALCFHPTIGVEIFGSKRWIRFPVIDQFQPSELAKIVVVVALAAWYARWQAQVPTFWRGYVIPGSLVLVPVLLIGAETDVGTAVSLSVAIAAVMFAVGVRLWYLIPTALAAMFAAGAFVFQDSVRWARIEAWMDIENPALELGTNMQQVRALYALGNGGVWGVGLGNGTQKFGSLSLAHMDFIFPMIGEELGLFWTLAVVLCYVFIAIGGFGIAAQATSFYDRALALGLTCVLVLPAIVNIAVTTALLPNDGLPLPFVSYGGTNMVFSLIAVGMLLGVHRRSKVAVQPSFSLNREGRLVVRL